MVHLRILLLVTCLMVGALSGAQQNESDRLRKEQKELQNKIEFNKKLLETTEANKTNLTENIGLIDRKIEYRADLLDNLGKQLSQLSLEIEDLKKEIESLKKEIDRQKSGYRLMLIQAYKMRSSSASLLFILSSESFNQANRRMEYLKQLSKFRSDQIRKIEAARKKLDEDLIALEQKKLEKDQLASTQKNEQLQYVADREYQKKQIENLSGKEIQIQNELAAWERRSRTLQNDINAALNKEILDKREKDESAGGLTEKEREEIVLNTKDFESDKGKLPWPVAKGEISKGYGKQAHPVHINVYTYNNGIDITTVKGSTVKAVYGGEVTSVIIIPGAGKAVIIAHGDYRTIYSNLQDTYVTKGQIVKMDEVLGTLLVSESGTSEIHFEIRKISAEGDPVNVNPTYWLRP
jgi:murein hydrolase activator